MKLEEFRNKLDKTIMYKVDNPNYTYSLPSNMTESDLKILMSREKHGGAKALYEGHIQYNSNLFS